MHTARRLASVVLSILAVLACILVALFLVRIPIAEEGARRLLALNGYPGSTLEVAAISLDGAQVRSIQIPRANLTVDQLTLDYDLNDILVGRVEALKITGLALSVDATADASTGGSAQEIGFDPAPLQRHFGRIDIEDSHAHVKLGDSETLLLTLSGWADFVSAQPEVGFALLSADPPASFPLRTLDLFAIGTATKNKISLNGTLVTELSDWSGGGWNFEDVSYDGLITLSASPTSIDATLGAPVRIAIERTASGAGERDLHIVGNTGTLTLAAAIGEQGITSLTKLSGAIIEFPEFGLRLANLETSLPFSLNGLIDRGSASGVLTSTKATKVFEPMAVDVEVSPVADRWVLGGALKPAGIASTRIDLSGYFEPSKGNGTFSANASEILFSPASLQPTDFTSAFSFLEKVSGPISVDAQITVTPSGDVTSSGQIDFNSVGATVTGVEVSGITGTLTLNDLFEVNTPPNQTLEATAILAPLPLAAPRMDFQLLDGASDPVIAIKNAQTGLAGGLLSLTDTSFRPLASTQSLELAVEDIDLKQLLEDWAADKLSGTGTLAGSIPIELVGDDIVIENGQVGAVDGGVLQMNWGDAREALVAQGEQVSLLVQVLEDFHYDVLDVGIDRPAGEQVRLQVRLEGKNPAVLDGYPFKLNVGLGGNLETMLGALAQGQSLTMRMIGGQLNDAQ